MKRYISLILLTVSFTVAVAQNTNDADSTSAETYFLSSQPEIEFDGKSPFDDIYIPSPQARSLDNILWHKNVWRMIDMREQVNYPLYYPLKETNGRLNLFLTIFNLLKEGKVHAYTYNDKKEDFSEEQKLSFEQIMQLSNIDIYEIEENEKGDTVYVINEVDIPNESVLKFYIKEVWYFDALESCMKFKIECIAPQLYYTNESGVTEKRVMFWIPFDELRPWLARQSVVINNKNTNAFISYDDLFQKRRFIGHIYKADNIQNRALIEYCNTPEEVRYEQNLIESEIMNFELDLWEY